MSRVAELLHHHNELRRIFYMMATINVEPDGTEIREMDSITRTMGELLDAEQELIIEAFTELTEVAEVFQSVAQRLIRSVRNAETIANQEADNYDIMSLVLNDVRAELKGEEVADR